MAMRRIRSLRKKPTLGTPGAAQANPSQEQTMYAAPQPIPQTQPGYITSAPRNQYGQEQSQQQQMPLNSEQQQAPQEQKSPPSQDKQPMTDSQKEQNAEHVTIQKVAEPSPVTGMLTPSVSVSQIDDDKELFRVKSFWMLDLFPNELIIRQKTLHVIMRDFLSSNIETMMLEDVGLVQVNNGIIFSSLIVRYRIPHEDLQIAKIPKAQAMKAKAILDSLMVSKKTNKSGDIELVESAH